MHLDLDIDSALKYKSKSQKARFLTEEWAHRNVSCPGCGARLERYANNTPVADFYCLSCDEDYELKAVSKTIGKTISDGAYHTMIERLSSRSNPNLLLLQYDAECWSVKNLTAIPKYYFTPNIIQKRAPLSSTAKRAGWVGCNILVGEIPVVGKIHIISNQLTQSLEKILAAWKKTSFLKEIKNAEAKGWLLQTMLCIDRIGKREFDLKDIYEFEKLLRETFPDNNHIKEKLRQQLQILRDRGYLDFVGGGVYALI
jgi:type II restriction enzyme